MRRNAPCLALLVLVSILPARAASPAPAGTLDRLADRLDEAAGKALEGTEPGAIDLRLTVSRAGEATPRLARLVTDLVLARLLRRGLRGVLVDEGRAGGRVRRGIERVLALRVDVTEGHLRVSGELREQTRSLWGDLLRPDGAGVSHHLFAQTRVDAEVRAYLDHAAASGGGLRYARRRVRLGAGAVLALGAGDLDGDGRVEVVALHEGAVALLRPEASGGLKPWIRHVLTGAPAAVQPRRAMGTVVVADLDGDRRDDLAARTSKLAVGVVLSLTGDGKALEVVKEPPGYPIAHVGPGDTLAVCKGIAGRDLLDLTAITGSPMPQIGNLLPKSGYSLVLARVVRGGGAPRWFLGTVDSDGALLLVDGERPTAPVTQAGVGVAVHLGDLDDDGQPELALTGTGGAAEPERVTVMTLAGEPPALRRVWRSGQLAGAVTALTAGDLDGDGRLELLAAVQRSDGESDLVVFYR